MSASTLANGLILAVATSAGLDLTGHGDKRTLCCPFHDDRNPSAFLDIQRNVFYCSVCTSDGGWTAKRFAEELNQPWPPSSWDRSGQSPSWPRGQPARPRLRVTSERPEPEFGPAEAQRAWSTFQACARDDDRVEADRPAYDYMESRGLMESWEERAFGIVPDDPSLPGSTSTWRRRAYLVCAPLYDHTGRLTSLQARSIDGRAPKTLAPKGSRTRGTCFASASGLAVLRGDDEGQADVILAEGLTDHLALTVASSVPVLSSPGAGSMASIVGGWAVGRRVWVASDADLAGENTVRIVADRLHAAGARTVRRLVWPAAAKDACEVVDHLGMDALGDFLESEVLQHAR